MVKKNNFEKRFLKSSKEKPKKEVSESKPLNRDINVQEKQIKKLKEKMLEDKQNKISVSKKSEGETPSLKLKNESEIALDFAIKVYKNFNKMVKSIALFGSSVKKNVTSGSDIDIIIIIDDVSISWDQELIVWYREELNKILKYNPYRKSLHINTIKLSTWWEDLIRGDPVVLNTLRYSESLIDFGGFFEPLKYLLLKGKLKPSPEAIYNCLQRAPIHIQQSKISELGSIEGLYWAMVDSAHAALIAKGISPPSPEHISEELKTTFADEGKIDSKYIKWYAELLELHKNISHGKVHDLKGVEIDIWQDRTEEFLEVMTRLVKEAVEK